MKNKNVEVQDWGLIDYKAAWDKQEAVFAHTIAIKTEIRNRQTASVETEDTQDRTPNYLVFCEHPHVYTLGKSGKAENLLLDESGLEEKNATFYPINRGGDITYHGP